MYHNRSPEPRVRPQLFWLPYSVSVLVLLIMVLATTYFAHTNQVNDRLRFENRIQQTQDTITARLDTYASILHGVSGLLAANENIDRATFQRYISQLNIQSLYPGIQGVGFSKRVEPDQLNQLVATMRRQNGVPDFHIWPADPRDTYTTVIYLEPLDQRNAAAIGYDMFTEPTRRAAMERARDTGRIAATPIVTLVQEIDANKQPGFLIYLPVYRGGTTPATVAERRANLLGYVYSPFRARDLFNGIFGTQTLPRIAFQLYSGTATAPANLLFNSNHSNAQGTYRPSFTSTRHIQFAGQDWTVVYTTQEAFENPNAQYILWFMLLTGIAVSVALFFILRSQVHAHAAAEAAVRVRDGFLSVASHELKSPLTVMHANAQLMLRRVQRAGSLLERDERSLQTIVAQAKRLDRLISALLDHSRLQSGHFSIDRQPMNFAALVQQIVQETQPTLQEHTLELNQVSESLTVLGDELRLGQVLQNLISNAIKYSPHGGTVVIDVAQQDDHAVLSITDSGIGIPESALPHLFEQFYRAPNISSQRISGLGIGLYLTQEIVHQHDGSIAVISVEGAGSTFTVRLPLMTHPASLHAPGTPINADQRSSETIPQN